MKNRLELQSFYNYLFREEDYIEKRIKGTKELSSELIEKRRQAIEKEVKDYFFELFVEKDDSQKIPEGTPNESKTESGNKIVSKLKEKRKQLKELKKFIAQLHPVLHALKSIHLGKILYPSLENIVEAELQKIQASLKEHGEISDDKLMQDEKPKRNMAVEYKFRTDDETLSSLRKIEEKYNHFPDLIHDKKFQEKFLAFYKLNKVIADTLESSENEDNTSQALLNAYKMLVLFSKENEPHSYFKSISQYLKIHNYLSHDMPLHDALQWSIPKRASDEKIDVAGWQKLIYTSGKKGYQLFNLATKIEKELGRAPQDLNEAITTAMKVSYSKLAEYKDHPEITEFAKLCIGYGIEEYQFNLALKIFLEKRKKSDNLPDAKDITIEGYHLVKLPIDDMRAFILGHLTDCCQSIGGHSETCVIDGVTRPNCGFYVMLKSKEKTSTDTPLLNGKIDYKKFDIVGQAYAWRSISGNLTFDSWENLRPANNPQAVELLKRFAEQVVKTSPEILRVTIGRGGKTPDEFKTKENGTAISEIMKEGTQYGDSIHQNIIAKNEEKVQAILLNLKKLFEIEFKEIKTEEFEMIFKSNNIISPAQSESLMLWFKLPGVREQFRNPSTDPDYVKYYREQALLMQGKILTCIYLLHESGIKPDLQIVKTFAECSHIQIIRLAKAIIKLNEANLFENPIVKQSLFNKYHTEHYPEITAAFLKLKEIKLENNQRALEIVARHPDTGVDIVNQLQNLMKSGVAPDSELFNLILSSYSYNTTEMIKQFIKLKNSNLLDNEFIYQTVLKNAKNYSFEKIPGILFNLNDSKLLENKELVTRIFQTKNPDGISNGLLTLKSIGLLENKIYQDLIFSSEYPDQFGKLIQILHKENLLENKPLFDNLQKHPRYLSSIVSTYHFIEEQKLEASQLFKDAILKDPEQADSINAILWDIKYNFKSKDAKDNIIQLSKEVSRLIIESPNKKDLRETLSSLRIYDVFNPDNIHILEMVLLNPKEYYSMISTARSLPREIFQYKEIISAAAKTKPAVGFSSCCELVVKAKLLENPNIRQFLIANMENEGKLKVLKNLLSTYQSIPIDSERFLSLLQHEMLVSLINKKLISAENVAKMNSDEFKKIASIVGTVEIEKDHPLFNESKYDSDRLKISDELVSEFKSTALDTSRLLCVLQSKVVTSLLKKKLLTVNQLASMSDEQFNDFTLGNPAELDKQHPQLLKEFKWFPSDEEYFKIDSPKIQIFQHLLQLLLNKLIHPKVFHSLIEQEKLNPFADHGNFYAYSFNVGYFSSYNDSRTPLEKLFDHHELKQSCIENVSKRLSDILEARNNEDHAFRKLQTLCNDLKVGSALSPGMEKYGDEIYKKYFTKPDGKFFVSKDNLKAMRLQLNKLGITESLLPILKDKIVQSVKNTIENTKWPTSLFRGTVAIEINYNEKKQTDPDIALLWNKLFKSSDKKYDELENKSDGVFAEMVSGAELATLHGSLARHASVDHFFKEITYLKELDMLRYKSKLKPS